MNRPTNDEIIFALRWIMGYDILSKDNNSITIGDDSIKVTIHRGESTRKQEVELRRDLRTIFADARNRTSLYGHRIINVIQEWLESSYPDSE